MLSGGSVLLGLAVVFVLRVIERSDRGRDLLQRLPFCIDLGLQYYVIGYALLLAESCAQVYEFQVRFGDLDTLSDTAKFSFPPNTAHNATAAAEWEQRTAMPAWLRVLSSYAGWCLIISILIAGVHTFLHLVASWQKDQDDDRPCGGSMTKHHDYAIQVVAMPVVFAVLSNKGVLRMVSICTGRFSVPRHDSWPSLIEMENDLYKSYNEVAELYEGWALWCFGALCIQMLVANVDGKGFLVTAVQRITMQGVGCFVMVCLATSLWSLGITELEGPPFNLDVCGEYPSFCQLDKFFAGAKAVASTIAIYNIAVFEVSCHEKLEEFSPFLKFLGTKILVSISYIQKAGCTILFPHWSKELQQLAYSSVLVYEVLFIAILHVFAWGPWDSWYCTPWVAKPRKTRVQMDVSQQVVITGLPLSNYEKDATVTLHTFDEQVTEGVVTHKMRNTTCILVDVMAGRFPTDRPCLVSFEGSSRKLPKNVTVNCVYRYQLDRVVLTEMPEIAVAKDMIVTCQDAAAMGLVATKTKGRGVEVDVVAGVFPLGSQVVTLTGHERFMRTEVTHNAVVMTKDAFLLAAPSVAASSRASKRGNPGFVENLTKRLTFVQSAVAARSRPTARPSMFQKPLLEDDFREECEDEDEVDELRRRHTRQSEVWDNSRASVATTLDFALPPRLSKAPGRPRQTQAQQGGAARDSVYDADWTRVWAGSSPSASSVSLNTEDPRRRGSAHVSYLEDRLASLEARLDAREGSDSGSPDQRGARQSEFASKIQTTLKQLELAKDSAVRELEAKNRRLVELEAALMRGSPRRETQDGRMPRSLGDSVAGSGIGGVATV
mmetsp:Transcript_34579/g.83414  ORF Transcript_34579/g.83414 Transcript_34579/m.83414 type:complete len:831 (+) Transcript_34579:65-2557(+)